MQALDEREAPRNRLNAVPLDDLEIMRVLVVGERLRREVAASRAAQHIAEDIAARPPHIAREITFIERQAEMRERL